MKKFIVLFLSTILFFFLTGCRNSPTNSAGESIGKSTTQPESTSPTDESSDENGTESQKILIAYFSKTGNTQTVASMIAEETGGTLFKIETVTPYPEDYDETVDIAREEQDSNARPELSTHVVVRHFN